MSIEEQIGAKIRNLRNQNGLTQEELADRTELTKGFISQMERGLTAPSVSTLLDIVECLGTNLSDFFHEENELQIVYPKEDYFEKEDEHKNSITWLIATAQSRSMEPILVQLQPGQSMPRGIRLRSGWRDTSSLWRRCLYRAERRFVYFSGKPQT